MGSTPVRARAPNRRPRRRGAVALPGWSVCIYNPDLDPGHDGADNIISYLTQAITAAIAG
jgi:hypothetical protein